MHLPLPRQAGLPPAALALARWEEHGALHQKGQVQLQACETSQQEGHPVAGALQAQLKGQVQLKARGTGQQGGRPVAGALQAQL